MTAQTIGSLHHLHQTTEPVNAAVQRYHRYTDNLGTIVVVIVHSCGQKVITLAGIVRFFCDNVVSLLFMFFAGVSYTLVIRRLFIIYPTHSDV